MRSFFSIFFIGALSMNPMAQVVDSTFGIPTSLDPCCSIYGTTGCNFGGLDQAFLAIHLDDNRILLVGDTRWQGESDFAIARLMPDGQYDQSAGFNGQVRIDLGYPNDSCIAAAPYQDDRILMGGCVWQTGTSKYINLIARIDFDGNLDPSFGTLGHLTINLPTTHEMITKILPQPDGKILIGGNALYGHSFDFPDSVDVFLGRLLANGQVDSTFGENGFLYHRWESTCNVAMLGDLSLDNLGRIVLTGGSYHPYPHNYGGSDLCHHNIFLCRYLSNGQPDTGFGEDGSLELDYTGYGRGNALMHYDDNRILLAGGAGGLIPQPSYMFLTRLMPDGSPDLSFADNGRFKKAIINPGNFSGGNVEPFGLLRLRGRVLVGVLNEIGGDDPGFGAICLTESGKIDSVFGDAGRFNAFPDISINSFINQISSTSDNNFFLSGYTRILQPNNMAILKVRWDGSSDTHEHSVVNNIKMYPNPVKDGLFYLDLGSSVGIDDYFYLKIRDTNGRVLHEQNNFETSVGINTATFPTGIYWVELIGDESHFMGKIVVQND